MYLFTHCIQLSATDILYYYIGNIIIKKIIIRNYKDFKTDIISTDYNFFVYKFYWQKIDFFLNCCKLLRFNIYNAPKIFNLPPETTPKV